MITLTRKQKEKIILDYLCYDQIGQHAYGEDDDGNSVEIQWSDDHEAWEIIECIDDETYTDYEYCGCEKAVSGLQDTILDKMISSIYTEDELEELVDEEKAEL